eukprot:8185985-Pyramimonas_sp.AAC.1
MGLQSAKYHGEDEGYASQHGQQVQHLGCHDHAIGQRQQHHCQQGWEVCARETSARRQCHRGLQQAQTLRDWNGVCS